MSSHHWKTKQGLNVLLVRNHSHSLVVDCLLYSSYLYYLFRVYYIYLVHFGLVNYVFLLFSLRCIK